MERAGPPADLLRAFALPVASRAILVLGVPSAEHEEAAAERMWTAPLRRFPRPVPAEDVRRAPAAASTA